jgi:hypothetical protein
LKLLGFNGTFLPSPNGARWTSLGKETFPFIMTPVTADTFFPPPWSVEELGRQLRREGPFAQSANHSGCWPHRASATSPFGLGAACKFSAELFHERAGRDQIGKTPAKKYVWPSFKTIWPCRGDVSRIVKVQDPTA